MTDNNNSAVTQLKQYTQIIYILQLVSLAIGVTSIIGIVMNYIKRDDVRGTMLESHFQWQINTFWWMLGLVIVGSLLTFIGIGVFILIGAVIWYIYRAVKGLIALSENKPMPAA